MAEVKQHCGCVVVYGGTFMKIDYCLKHAAAPELYKITKMFYEWLSGQYNPSPMAIDSVMERSKEILARLENEAQHGMD